jgi:hypothetical protein
MSDFVLRVVLAVIGAITVLSGLLLLVAPDWTLHFIAQDQTALAGHLFATVGMFMVITGALFLQSLLTHSNEPAIPFWIGVQKAASAVLMAWAILRGLLFPLAYLVAGFDAGFRGVRFAVLAPAGTMKPHPGMSNGNQRS